MAHSLYVAHIAVLGYWLGAELVINSAFRRASLDSERPFAERRRLMDLVMDADQHVRRALIVQLGLGCMLAGWRGYLPGDQLLVLVALIAMVAWLTLLELTHLVKDQPTGPTFARMDRTVRYLVIAALLVTAVVGLSNALPTPGWLAWKLILFAVVMLCGLAIRCILIHFFASWQQIEHAGSSAPLEDKVRRDYYRSSGVLVLLWASIAGIVALSLLKPG